MSSFVEYLGIRKRAVPSSLRENVSLLTVDEERAAKRLPFEEQVCLRTQKMYRHPENGLCKIAEDLHASVPEVPERRINVLIIGNHSSGKSSFINWYVGEDLQKTGVAMETSKFTIVCHGKRRETLTASAVTKLMPKLQSLESITGIMDHLSGEVSPSKAHQFQFVNLIDTPGIVDIGRDDFAFDLALKEFADMADLILVFLDPQGQALCKRTMAHLEALCVSHPDKLSLWLTKCDTLRNERDLMKVTQQISRELSRRPVIASLELWLSPIAIPGHASGDFPRLNQINELEKKIERHISEHFQNKVLQDVIRQCGRLERIVEERRTRDSSLLGGADQSLGCFQKFAFIVMLVLSVALAFFLVEAETQAEYLKKVLASERVYDAKETFHNLIDTHLSPEAQLIAVAATSVMIALAGCLTATGSSKFSDISRRDGRLAVVMNGYSRKIQEIRMEADKLYNEYLRIAVGDE